MCASSPGALHLTLGTDGGERERTGSCSRGAYILEGEAEDKSPTQCNGLFYDKCSPVRLTCHLWARHSLEAHPEGLGGGGCGGGLPWVVTEEPEQEGAWREEVKEAIDSLKEAVA